MARKSARSSSSQPPGAMTAAPAKREKSRSAARKASVKATERNTAETAWPRFPSGARCVAGPIPFTDESVAIAIS